MTATIRVRVPMDDRRPRPTYGTPVRVAAGSYPLTHRWDIDRRFIEVAEQTGVLTGWCDDHPNRHTVLDVEVQIAD